MASFADLVPLTADVEIRGQIFTVRGIKEQQIGELANRFPEIEGAIRQGSITGAEAARLFLAAMTALIAAGCGVLGEAKEEAGIAGLEFGEKFSLIEAIVRLTMPTGVGPFAALAQRFGLGAIMSEVKNLIANELQKNSVSSASSPSPAPPSSSPASQDQTSSA